MNMNATSQMGEWTVYSVMKLRQKHWHEEDKNNAIAIAHNEALAAAWRKGHSDAQAPALERIDELHKQLEAARDENWRHAYDNLLIDYTQLREQLTQVTKERDNATGNCMSLSQLLFADRLLLAQVMELATHNITGCGTCASIRKLMEDYGRRRLAERESG
jgi:hypothetical protein